MSQPPPTFSIRPAEPSDAPAIAELWQRVFGYPEPRNEPHAVVAEKLRHQPELLLVATRAQDPRPITPSAPPEPARNGFGALVFGTIMAGYDGHRGWLYRLAVSPGHRRRGLGLRLVREAEARLRALGCLKVNLQTHRHSSAAGHFWRAAGYLVEERVSFGKELGGRGEAD